MKKIILPLLLLSAVTLYAQTNVSFNVHFDTDRYHLTADAVASLDSFVAANSKDTKIKLYGHTDIMADYDYNDALSLKRTHAVKNYLIKKGFTAANIVEERGFGKRRPLNRNHGELEMYMNRRVEIITPENAGSTAAQEMETTTTGKTIIPEKTLTETVLDPQSNTGTNIVLKNMNFYGGTHVIVPESMPVLMELVQVMKSNPALEIAVEGHICCQDSTADGYDIGTRTKNLSENRAREICYYLSKNGIASARLKYKGFGHQFPLHPYPEKNEEEREENRRVEIKILNK